ncbi:Potassium/sodium hyperpolarization-activated cyclic nucleotide-gated channel [Coccomyxa sp. Obi]|nr:Potassium/sodium hyperpolarization-activated cyclic nucleotide-gated channel [Coccomyxa sp. Obi]
MRCRRSTNSFRTKLFGQAKRVPGEEIVDASVTAGSDRVRVHPLSNFRRYWDLTAIALTIHTVLVLPFRAAFFWDYYRELEAHHTILEQLQVDWMLATELFIDLFFLSDILLNFNTGYIADQVLVMERHLVRRHYLRTWFVLDLIASVPMDLLLRGRRFDILRLPRLLKVIRIMHYRTLTQTVHDLRRTPIVSSISRFHIQILQMFLFVFIWVHWDACLQYECACSGCWVYASGLSDRGIYEKYTWAVLKAWSETVSAGYGAQDPVTAFDCWMTTASLFTGMCIWTFLGGIVTTLLIHLNAASSEYTAKITALNQYMAHRRLPQGLRQRIRDSYEARWKAEKHFDEDEIMQELPNSLRTEVCLYTCGDLIASVPFFEDAEEGFTTSLVTLLRPAVEVNGLVVTVLKKGSYFGEIGLLRNCRRTASIRALSETCDLFVLTKRSAALLESALFGSVQVMEGRFARCTIAETAVFLQDNFDAVMKEYPESSKAMDLIAEHRLRTLHASTAWRSKQDAVSKATSLGSKIEHVLEMGEEADASSAQREETLPIHASASGISPFQPVHTSHFTDANGTATADGKRRGFPGICFWV